MRTFTDTDTQQGELLVPVSDYELATDGQTLVAYGLGTCVAVVLFDADAGVGALAHAMLPERGPDAKGPTGTFVAEVTETMVRELISAGASYSDLRGALVGGAVIFDLPGIDDEIGSRTVETARARLKELGVPVVAEAVGDDHGRTVSFDTVTGTLSIETARSGNQTLFLGDDPDGGDAP